jgi:hypothetical protein
MNALTYIQLQRFLEDELHLEREEDPQSDSAEQIAIIWRGPTSAGALEYMLAVEVEGSSCRISRTVWDDDIENELAPEVAWFGDDITVAALAADVAALAEKAAR